MGTEDLPPLAANTLKESPEPPTTPDPSRVRARGSAIDETKATIDPRDAAEGQMARNWMNRDFL